MTWWGSLVRIQSRLPISLLPIRSPRSELPGQITSTLAFSSGSKTRQAARKAGSGKKILLCLLSTEKQGAGLIRHRYASIETATLPFCLPCLPAYPVFLLTLPSCLKRCSSLHQTGFVFPGGSIRIYYHSTGTCIPLIGDVSRIISALVPDSSLAAWFVRVAFLCRCMITAIFRTEKRKKTVLTCGASSRKVHQRASDLLLQVHTLSPCGIHVRTKSLEGSTCEQWLSVIKAKAITGISR